MPQPGQGQRLVHAATIIHATTVLHDRLRPASPPPALDITTPHLANLAEYESPAFHLRRCQDNGVFDRFAMHVRALWAAGRDVGENSAAPASESQH